MYWSVLLIVLPGILAQETRDSGQTSDMEIRARLSSLEEHNRHLERRVMKLERMTSQAVAFSAFVSTSYEYSNDDVVVFDRIITNLGDAYSTSTNRFTCPIHGLYSFTVSIFQTYNMVNAVACVIVLENVGEVGELTVKAYATESLTDSSSTTTYVECMAGQRVWVEVDDNDGGQVYGGIYEPDSMFSGVLITPL